MNDRQRRGKRKAYMRDILKESRLCTIEGSELLGSLDFLFETLRRGERGAEVLHHDAMKPSEIRVVLFNYRTKHSSDVR